MNTLRNTLRNARNAIGAIGALSRYLFQFLWCLFHPKAVLVSRLLAAESQLAMCMRRFEQKQHPRPRFTAGFRLLWVVLSKLLSGWEQCAHLMQPATVKKWHTTAFRLFWRWKSRRRMGRPSIPESVKQLIRRLSQENPLWGARKIRDTLLLLGYDVPCEDTVRKYMVHGPREKSTTWLPFLRNHLDVSWAMDFFTVTTFRFATMYVFVVLDHGRRRVIHFATTYSPSMNWVIQQFREAMPFGEQPRYMFRDNDGIYGHGVRAFLRSCGIREVRTAYRSPWQNPYIERFNGALHRELLDHVIIISQGHLEQLLREFIGEYYHVARPHQGLNGDTPIPPQKTPVIPGPSKMVSIPVAGGLHHRYVRVAA